MQSNRIRIGAVSIDVGPYQVMGEEGMAGVELAIAEFGGQVAGKRIALFKAGSNAIPDSASSAANDLIERDNVDIVIGPLSGNEGLAVRDYARTRPDKTFLNGNAAAQEITLRNPAPNFFSFCANAVQWMAGLGTYAYEVMGYRRVVTLGEDYSYPHGQVGGFMLEFCRAGGRVVKKFWVPLGTVDFHSVIEAIPEDIDAIYVCVAGADAIHFLEQYTHTRTPKPLIGGSTLIDQTVLSVSGKLADSLVGMPTAGPISDDDPQPAWQAFVKHYRTMFPTGFASPSLFTYGFYVNTKAALLALQQIGAQFTENQENFREALSTLEYESPTGRIRLDHHRQVIANQFINVLDRRPNGTLYNRLVKVIPQVNSTLGIPEEEYLKIGILNATNPNCP